MMGSSDDELWKETKLIVEANSYEMMTLWEKWVDKTEWQQHLQGRLVTVGARKHAEADRIAELERRVAELEKWKNA